MTSTTDDDSVGAAAVPGATIARLVQDLAGVVDVLIAPDGLDTVVDHVTIHDPGGPSPLEAGDLVLGVGLGADAAHIREVVAAAGRATVAGIALKTHGVSRETLTEAADRAGVVLLEVAPEMAWEQLHTLLRTSMASAGAAPDVMTGPKAPLGDLFALANAVSAMVGGPTTIEDTKSRVLAHSSLDEPVDEPRRETILGRQVPDEWMDWLRERGVFRELWGSRDVVRVEGIEGRLKPRLAIAVRAGDEILGAIWVAEGSEPLGEAAEQALRQAAEIASLHLVRHRSGEDLERRMRGRLLSAVLEGRGSLSVVADRLGLHADGYFAVIAFALRAAPDAELALQRQRILELISMYSAAYRRRAAQVAEDHTIYTLVPVTEPDDLAGLLRFANDVVDQTRNRLSIDLLAGVGSVVDHLREVPRSRTEADQVVRVLGERTDGRAVALIDEVRAQTFLLELRDLADNRPELRAGKLQALAAYDRDHNGDYVETLAAYLEAFGDVPAAAETIHVHPNTFRYRLKRLSEIAAVDLEDPDERLALTLQLRLR